MSRSPSAVKDRLPRCPNSPGLFQGTQFDFARDAFIGHSFNLPCKSWDCPYCNPRRLLHTRSRVYNGDMSQYVEEFVLKYPEKRLYVQKMLTLTYPGLSPIDYPKYNRTEYTPAEAYDQMSSKWNNLLAALRRKYGKFYYFKIVERQRDGYPHFHILMVGEAIIPKDILSYIRSLWCAKYRMGFADLGATSKFKNYKHAIRYTTKYLMKTDVKKIPGRFNIKKGARLFSASRGAIEKMARNQKKYNDYQIFFGSAGPDGFHEIEIPMVQVKPFIRTHMADPLRHRVLTDESDMQCELAKLKIIGKR